MLSIYMYIYRHTIYLHVYHTHWQANELDARRVDGFYEWATHSHPNQTYTTDKTLWQIERNQIGKRHRHEFPAHNCGTFHATAIHRTFYPQDDQTICFGKKDCDSMRWLGLLCVQCFCRIALRLVFILGSRYFFPSHFFRLLFHLLDVAAFSRFGTIARNIRICDSIICLICFGGKTDAKRSYRLAIDVHMSYIFACHSQWNTRNDIFVAAFRLFLNTL